MISRRSFIKLSGLAVIGLGAGYGAGKLIKPEGEKYFAVHGFLPDDESVVKNIVQCFGEKTGSANLALLTEGKWNKVITRAFNGLPNKSGNGDVIIRITKINSPVNADILVTDNNTIVYNPDSDFTSVFSIIRSEIKDRNADYFFTAEYKERNLFSNMLNSDEKFAVIENQYGVADKINLKNSYKNIQVTGPQGKTGLKIENGLVHVHTAACKHEICKHSGIATNIGDIIACAPNRVIVRIEKA